MAAHLDDTIAAISTAPGRAGTALIRISGSHALAVAEAMGVVGLEPRRATTAPVRHPDGRRLDRAVVTHYAAPASYTGEDVVEISSHGGVLVPELILDAACAAGARLAMAGEFTRRAYLNGKLDLVQVEATQDLIEATSPAHHAAALFQLDGALSRRVEELRAAVVELRALLAYDIDFPEEDDGPVPRARIQAAASEVRTRIRQMLSLAPEGERLRDGVVVVLAGAPNAGKSSIFNSLLGSQRAIVTEIPGTTRDAIEADTSIEGFPFRLVDTAGVRPDAEHIERLGIEVARRYLASADAVLLCVEMGREWTDEERALAAEVGASGADLIVLRTKTDLTGEGVVCPEGELRVSARTGLGIEALRDRLAESGFGGLRRRAEPALVTRARQARALERAAAFVSEFEEAIENGLPAEIADTHLADATLSLEEIVGATDVEDILAAIFETFCVGK
ncbi:MAG: tRNA uridine-5-carboxymethylaminomethyl(34) synthesis GTPase MnmE [Gemmatimonadota bacterium]|nr:tRNA uridine-5-carboxymethylaminomethyl(34) synthesis GTPase MnmE [Gemmatimonadota bacterium]